MEPPPAATFSKRCRPGGAAVLILRLGPFETSLGRVSWRVFRQTGGERTLAREHRKRRKARQIAGIGELSNGLLGRSRAAHTLGDLGSWRHHPVATPRSSPSSMAAPGAWRRRQGGCLWDARVMKGARFGCGTNSDARRSRCNRAG